MKHEDLTQSPHWFLVSYIFNEGIKYVFRKHKAGLKWCLSEQLVTERTLTKISPRWGCSFREKPLVEWCHGFSLHPTCHQPSAPRPPGTANTATANTKYNTPRCRQTSNLQMCWWQIGNLSSFMFYVILHATEYNLLTGGNYRDIKLQTCHTV